MTESGSRGRIFPVAALFALLWLAGAGWALFGLQPFLPEPRAIIEAAALLLAPVAAIFALAAALSARTGAPMMPTTLLSEGEADLAGVAVRLEGLRQGLATDLASITQAGSTLEAQCAAARTLAAELTQAAATATEAGRSLLESLPAANAEVEQVRQSLLSAAADARTESAQTTQTTAALATGFKQAQQQGSAAAQNLSDALANLSTLAGEGKSRSEASIRAIRVEADDLFELLENTLIARREALQRQGEAMGAQLEDGWKRLEAMAATASGKLETRLEALAKRAREIEERLQAQLAATETLAQTGERSFQLLDARLQHSSQFSTTALDKLAARVSDVNSDLAGLTAPLKETEGASLALERAVATLKETALQTVDVLGETLPTHTVAAGRAADALQTELRGLLSAIDETHARALGLAAPIADSRTEIDAATARFVEQRSAIESAGHALVVELNQARNLIGEVEEQTRDTSLSAATRLVDAMGRVREVATQATGTMRDMLDGLLAEARESLSASANEAMRASYALPVAEKAREAEAAATAAAERTAQSMAALAQTLKLLDERSESRINLFEEERQAALLSQAGLLRERLEQSGLSLATALGKEMSDDDWAQWRRGERGLFNRRTLSLLDKREARDLKAALEADPALKGNAQRYVGEFAALAERLPALAPALNNSDQGRIAAALHEVLES